MNLRSKSGEILSMVFTDGAIIPVGATNFKLPKNAPFHIVNDAAADSDPVTLTVKLARQKNSTYPLVCWPGGVVSLQLVREIVTEIPAGSNLKWNV